jgi:hypothetical protein
MDMLTFSVSKESDKSSEEIFNRINTIDKLLSYEKEFEEVKLEHKDKSKGVALIEVKIFGKEIKGKMRYIIEKDGITAIVNSKDIKHLRFGYFIKKIKKGSKTTQFVEVDTGNSIKNLLVKLFFAN